MTLDALLDAAEEVVSAEGITGLTLDAVAARADVSKGGLLHHFPSKDALVRAMIERIVASWRAMFLAAVDAAVPGPGRTTRALLSLVAVPGANGDHAGQGWTRSCQRMSMTLMAAMVSSPQHLEPLRASYRDVFSRIVTDGLEAGRGELVMAALDGLWLWMMMGVAGEVGGAGGGRVKGKLEGGARAGRGTTLDPVQRVVSVLAAALGDGRASRVRRASRAPRVRRGVSRSAGPRPKSAAARSRPGASNTRSIKR
jgi:AcrR family transcriptional regulator